MSKLHVIFDRPTSTWLDEDTGHLTIRGATVVVTKTDIFKGTVVLTRLAMQGHGTDAARVLQTLPLSKFGFTVDGDWDDEAGSWTVFRIESLLRDGVLPPEYRVQEIIQELHDAREGGRDGKAVLGADTVNSIIALLMDRKA